MEATTRTALQALADAHRNLASELEAILRAARATDDVTPRAAAHEQQRSELQPAVWDPEFDTPLVQPKVSGTREEQDWSCLTYLGGIYAINKRHGRGANAAEVREYAMKAGYQDGRAVTAWSKGEGATQNDGDRQRWVNAKGVDFWVKRLAAKLGVTLPADLAEPWDAPDYSRATR